MATFEQQVLDLTNQERAKNGLSPLQANDELNYTAEKYAKEMSDRRFFSHTGLDGSKPWDRAKAVGYEAQTMGENIAAGQKTPQQVVQDWMNSPGHRANILRSQYKDLGVGFENNYWVQNFGSGDTNPATNIPGGQSNTGSVSNPPPAQTMEPISNPTVASPESTSNQGASPDPNPVDSQPTLSSNSFEPTNYEQYMLELINRARANPLAEEQRQGSSLGNVSSDAKQPLAWNTNLSKAAQDHNNWQDKNRTISHNGEGGLPWERAFKAGYDMSAPQSSQANENLSFGGSSTPKSATQYVEERHNSLYGSSGHRANFFDGNWKEAGIDFLGKQTSDGKNLTQASVVEFFGKPASGKTFLTGVAYNDLVRKDNFYTPGEGLGGIKVEAVRKSDNKTFTARTTSSGGYQVALDPGEYDVTFSEGKLTQPTKNTVKVDSKNVKLDLVSDKQVDSVFYTNPDLESGTSAPIEGANDTLASQPGEQLQPSNTLESSPTSDFLLSTNRGSIGLIQDFMTNAISNELSTFQFGNYNQVDNGLPSNDLIAAADTTISKPNIIDPTPSLV
ncbi:CAP domain-containing protein [Iningainema tapete]|uniref:SCP domain-containing protein n=1 Tax=Iningainema tapete BLCC-T55 TaxID=2748662 RepID=A0A8J7BX85_9CYAN|nr:CAP domain-containing protein [Iningainema tapete]MBD2773312.1 hypothetical protein [Iningainema tapete BLCC-T55]